eukprot:278452_1
MSTKRRTVVNYVVGCTIVVSLSLLIYTLTRPTGPNARTKRKRKHRKYNKAIVSLTKKPFDIHLVMKTMDGFDAHIAADPKNMQHRVKYGAQLHSINDRVVIGYAYESILNILTSTPVPITLTFRTIGNLCASWTKALVLKETSNRTFKQGRFAEAIALLDRAIALHPTNKMYHSDKVLMLIKVKDYKTALEECQIIRELDPQGTYTKGHYLRGLVLFGMKRYKAAAAAFQTVLKLYPGYMKAVDRLEECLYIAFGEEMTLEKYEFVDQRTRDLVNGYIRMNQMLFDENKSCFNIDFGINKICAIFLFIGTDKECTWNNESV